MHTLESAGVPYDHTVIIFSNEQNLTHFDEVKSSYRRVVLESSLPRPPVSSWDNHLTMLYATEICKLGYMHICTFGSKMGVPCDHFLEPMM